MECRFLIIKKGIKALVTIFLFTAFFIVARGQQVRNHIWLNFLRPDINRPRYYDFNNNTTWLLNQYSKLGVKWNRLTFSWNDIQPEKNKFDWKTYDEIVNYFYDNGINLVATLGGHFDFSRVPAWAGDSITDVLNNHPEYLQDFVKA